MISLFISLLQNVNIKEKMNNAPDKNYEIGVVIGTYLPFLILVIIAYVTYFYLKKKEQNKSGN